MVAAQHLYFADDLRLKTALFREADLNPEGVVAGLTRRIFCIFVLPLMLYAGVWLSEDSHWFRNLREDL